MFYLNVWLTVTDPADIPVVRDLLIKGAPMVREEAGCVRFEVYQSEADPARFLLNEHWQQKSNWETHRSGKMITEIYVPQVLPRVVREPHPSTMVG